MSTALKTHPVSVEPHVAELPRRGKARLYFGLQCVAGGFAFLLALAAMLLFMMNTIAVRVDTLIEEQNTAA